MNEVQLSDSLPIIETEIRQYQNLAGESIFEIGRRLKHVKENDLVHGEFIKWVEGQLNMDRTTANKFMKVADELPNVDTYRHLGSNALYMITTLPESERTKEHTTSNGEVKTPDEMTVRELSELKKRLKNQSETIDETTSQLKSREKENKILQSKLEDAENREPEVVERYTEPEDYEETKNMNNHLLKENEYYKNLTKNFKDEMNNFKKKEEVVRTVSVDQTEIVIEMFKNIERIIYDDSYEIDLEKIKKTTINILERMK